MKKEGIKHILIVSQYFFPEQFRINDIANEWIKRGYKVSVLTGIPNYPEGKFHKGYGLFKKRKQEYNEIKIIRIPIFPRGSRSITLMLNYLSFVISGFFFSTFTKLKPDVIFTYEVSPITQALPALWLGKRKNIKTILYVMDLWPDNVEVVAGVKSKKVLKYLNRMVDYIYNNTNTILTSSNSSRTQIIKRGIDSQKVKFWPQYAEDIYKQADKNEIDLMDIPQDGLMNITFAGNIGFAQGLDILIDVAALLKEVDVKIRFNIIGDGRAKSDLVDNVNADELNEYFNFIGRKNANDIYKYMALSDVSLIMLKKNKIFEMTIPAKFQSSLACAMPILLSADGEIATIVEENNLGFCAQSGDALSLRDEIIKLVNLDEISLNVIRQNVITFNKNNYDKNMLLDEIDEIF